MAAKPRFSHKAALGAWPGFGHAGWDWDLVTTTTRKTARTMRRFGFGTMLAASLAMAGGSIAQTAPDAAPPLQQTSATSYRAGAMLGGMLAV